MSGLRWWLFKKISIFGWWVCPEPQRSDLLQVMPSWDGFERSVAAALEPFARDSRHD